MFGECEYSIFGEMSNRHYAYETVSVIATSL